MNPNSILATLTEIEANPFRALFDEKQEALAIVERIEKQLNQGANHGAASGKQAKDAKDHDVQSCGSRARL